MLSGWFCRLKWQFSSWASNYSAGANFQVIYPWRHRTVTLGITDLRIENSARPSASAKQPAKGFCVKRCMWLHLAGAARRLFRNRAICAHNLQLWENYFSNRKHAGSIGGKAPFANSEFHRHSARKASSSTLGENWLTDVCLFAQRVTPANAIHGESGAGMLI